MDVTVDVVETNVLFGKMVVLVDVLLLVRLGIE